MAYLTSPLITDARSPNPPLATGQQVGSLLGREVSSSADSDTAAMIDVSRKVLSPSTNPSTKTIERRPSEEDLEQVLIKRVMEQARQDSYLTAKTIKEFGIKDQDALIAIAGLCAEQNGGATAEFINNFEITNEDALIAIALLCAEQSTFGTCRFFQNFNITTEPALIDIAKFCAEQNGAITAEFINNFGIKNQNALIEIAKLCAKKDVSTTCRFFQKFGITDQPALIEIAKFLAKQSGATTACYIQNFGITDQDALIEIAKLCAEQNGAITAMFIQHFDITNHNQTALIDIARLCAEQNGGDTARYIDNFKITSQDARIGIALLCSQQDIWDTCQCFQNFSITDETALIDIAKFWAERDGGITAESIEMFMIADENTRVDIAKLCACQDGGGTACYIQNFGIKDPAILIEIARLCAQQNGGQTARYIKNFDITDQATLIEIARLCAEQDAAETAPYIYQFHIQSEDRIEIEDGLIQIIKLCARQNGAGVLEALERSNLTDNTKQLKNLCYLQMFASNRHDFLPTQFLTTDVLPALRKISDLPAKLQRMLSKNHTDLTPREKFQLILFHISREAYFYQTGQKMTSEQQNRLLPIVEYRNRCLASFLARTFAQDLDGTKMKQYLDFRKGLSKRSHLAMLIPCSLITSETALADIQKYVCNYKDFLDNYDNSHFQTWASTAMTLHQSALSQKKKLDLLSQTCVDNPSPAEHIERLSLINALCVLKQEWRLEEDCTCDNMTKWLSDLLTTGVQNDDYIDLKGIDDFTNRYMNTWGSTRVPAAWLTYEKGLRTTGEDAIKDMFQTMIRSVLDRTYSQERYNTQNSPHLKKIQEIRPGLLDKWRECIPMQPIVESQEQIVNTADWQDLFLSGTEVVGSCQGINGAPDFNKCLMAYVMDGKNRMIAIKEQESEKIVARMIFRLLLDEGNSPVLFLDRLYPQDCSVAHKEAMIEFAKKEAERLGLPLVTEGVDGKPFDRTIQSLGSRAPYEYSDAADGIMKGGVFRISRLKRLN